ncbi:MAG: DUF2844 domain-containing protein [Steroidobacteraceae bacterium]
MSRPPAHAPTRPALLLSVGIAVALGACHTSWAALGGTADSVARDAALLSGSDAVTQSASYDLHEITAATGTTVREYVSRQGTVFAVSWEGRGSPDVAQLLGSSYAAYVAAAHAHRTGHHLVVVNTPDLVASVLVVQHRSIGHVHVPALLPAGVTPADLH